MNDLTAFVSMLMNAGLDFSKRTLESGVIEVWIPNEKIFAFFSADYTLQELTH